MGPAGLLPCGMGKGCGLSAPGLGAEGSFALQSRGAEAGGSPEHPSFVGSEGREGFPRCQRAIYSCFFKKTHHFFPPAMQTAFFQNEYPAECQAEGPAVAGALAGTRGGVTRARGLPCHHAVRAVEQRGDPQLLWGSPNRQVLPCRV